MTDFAASETAALRAERDKYSELCKYWHGSREKAIEWRDLAIEQVETLEREIKELRAQRCPMCGETDPSKNEVNCPAKWHKR